MVKSKYRKRIYSFPINHEKLSDEDIMRLVILPLTYKDNKRKQEAVSDAIQLADAIEDSEIRTMVFAGILTFADKIIAESDAIIIRRRISMTKIEAIIEQEKEEALRKNTEEVTEKVTREVTKDVTREVTKEVTFNLIFDLVNTGNLNREEAMRRVGLSDDEFGVQLEKYRQAHMESAVN